MCTGLVLIISRQDEVSCWYAARVGVSVCDCGELTGVWADDWDCSCRGCYLRALLLQQQWLVVDVYVGQFDV